MKHFSSCSITAFKYSTLENLQFAFFTSTCKHRIQFRYYKKTLITWNKLSLWLKQLLSSQLTHENMNHQNLHVNQYLRHLPFTLCIRHLALFLTDFMISKPISKAVTFKKLMCSVKRKSETRGTRPITLHNFERPDSSLLHLMCAIACAHASTLATSLMRNWNVENKRKIKNIKLNSW